VVFIAGIQAVEKKSVVVWNISVSLTGGFHHGKRRKMDRWNKQGEIIRASLFIVNPLPFAFFEAWSFKLGKAEKSKRFLRLWSMD